MRSVGIVVVLVALAAVAYWTLADHSAASPTGAFETATVDRGDVTQMISTSGAVRARITVEVGSQLSGQVAELLADFNTPVSEGDLLARIDPQTFARRLEEAEANLAVAEANVAVQIAAIQRAQANLNNAERNFERQSSLVENEFVSEAALDDAQAAFEAAQADLASAEAQLITAQASVLQRQAAREAARIDLERTEIRSPINGVVIDRAVDVGQTVAASLSAPILFTIAQDLTEIQIEANVDEADIGAVREGATTSFTVDAYPGRTFNGRVAQVRLAPNEEQNVVTYTVVITAQNPNRDLYPGMTANVDIITGARSDVLRIDNAAARFRAPDDWPSLEQGGGGQRGGGQRGGPGAAMIAQLEEIGVSESVRNEIQTEMRAVFQQMRGAFSSPNADRQALAAQMRSRTDDIVRAKLTPEQFTQFQAATAAASDTRSAVIYVVGEDGDPLPRRVRLGVSDDRFTEVVAGELTEGDAVVTRIVRGGAS